MDTSLPTHFDTHGHTPCGEALSQTRLRTGGGGRPVRPAALLVSEPLLGRRLGLSTAGPASPRGAPPRHCVQLTVAAACDRARPAAAGPAPGRTPPPGRSAP